MKKSMFRKVKLWFLLAALSTMIFTGCKAEEETPVPEQTKTVETEEKEYYDVETMEAKEVDYSEFEEEESTAPLSDGTQTGTDQFNTDPVPAGKQLPVEPEDAKVDPSISHTCTLTISCATILNNMDKLTKGKEALVPEDGIIFRTQEVTFYEGESVYDVLQREMKKNRIHMESSFTPMYNSAYIEGINNLYEFDCGDNSGWMYSVNGWFPNYGVSRYAVQDKDDIRFHYTCDLGRDLQ